MSTPKFIFLQLPPEAPVTASTDWAMWSALATAAATLVALGVPLFLHYKAERDRKRAHAERVTRRTRDVGPQLVGDVTRLQWGLWIMMRALRRASTIDSVARPEALARDFIQRKLTIDVLPGRDVFPGDVDMLVDPVREHLAALKAQIAMLNAMAERVFNGSHDPYPSREAAVQVELYLIAYQVIATANRAIFLMDALEPYLVDELKELNKSLRNVTNSYLRSLLAIAIVRNAELPNSQVVLPTIPEGAPPEPAAD